MRKWLLAMVALLSAVATNATSISDSRKANLMALPPFERACVLIRHYETLHTPKHWPTIAYGHVVKKGENYKKRQYSHSEAERILRKDLSQLCAYYRGYGADSLLLACLGGVAELSGISDPVFPTKSSRVPLARFKRLTTNTLYRNALEGGVAELSFSLNFRPECGPVCRTEKNQQKPQLSQAEAFLCP